MSSEPVVHRSGTFSIGEDLPVHRLGFGAMRITGRGIWGDPPDRAAAVALLRRAVELGVDFIDTADSYGPVVSEELIAEALHPYPDDLVIATKAGFTRTGPGKWHVLGFPEYLKQQCELSLRRLRVDTIDLFQLHRVDTRLPLAEQLGALVELRQAGKIKHIGLSEVTVAQLEEALTITPVATVQNLYNLSNRAAEPLLDACEARGIGFIPWFPVQTGELAGPGGPLDALAATTGHTPAQLALAWLLQRSPVMLPIPGTKSVSHLEENMSAASVDLDPDVVAALDAVTQPGTDPSLTGVNVRAR
jgi:aryl-alcohol dehydrogenase-like predicted oxidoreductase